MPNEVVITVSGKDQFSGTADKVKGSAGGMGKALGDVSKIAGGFVIGQGLAAAPGFLMDAAQAAADDAASVSKLKQAVENGGQSWDAYKGKLEDVIDAGMRKGFTDDQTRDALSLLIAQTGSAEEAMKRYGLAQDLARGANIDVVTASKLLGKVTDENVNVLGRYGISVQKGASETELFGAIQQKFGGQAETFAKSNAGQMEAAQIQMSELKETLGSALLPVMGAVSKGMLELADVIQTDIVPAVKEWYSKHQPEIQAALQEFSDFINEDLLPTVESIVDTFKTVWPEIEPIVMDTLAIIQNEIVTTLKIIRDILVIVMAVMRGDWGAAWDGIKQLATDALEGLVQSVALKMRLALDVVKFVGQLIVNWFSSLGGLIVDAIGDLKDLLLQAGRDVIDGLWNGMKEKYEDVKSWFKDLGSGIADGIKGALGINSPSTVMIPIGEAIIEGIQVGVENKKGGLLSQLADMVQAVKDKMAEASSAQFAAHGPTPNSGETGVGHGAESTGDRADKVGGRTRDEWKYIFGASGIPASEYEPRLKEMFGYEHGTLAVPRTGLAMLHKDEGVMPAAFMKELLQAVRGGSRGGPATVNVYPQQIILQGDAQAALASLGMYA